MLKRTDYFRELIPQPASAHLVCVGRGIDPHQFLVEWAATSTVDPVDQVWLNPDEKVTIELVREFQRDLLLQPVRGSIRLGILSRAHQLTSDAAHAMLKLLEDPPAHTAIVLGAEHEDQLLGTIISRCHRWHVRSGAGVSSDLADVQKLRRLNYRERVTLAETWSKEDGWRDHLVALVRGARQLFLDGQLSSGAVQRLLSYEQLAVTNATPRLLLENSLFMLGGEKL